MKSQVLNQVFAEFCESQTHLDSLLSQVNPTQKTKVATLLSAFLRRPLTIAKYLGIELESSPEAFWELSFLKLKKHEGIHALLSRFWENWESAPTEGSAIDFPPSLFQSWVRDWGQEHAEKMARLLSQEPLTTIRFHRRAFTEDGQFVPAVDAWLKSSDLPKSRAGNIAPFARVFRGYAKVQSNDLFKEGYFEIQDEGSQLMSRYALDEAGAAPFLSATPRVERFTEKLSVHPVPALPALTVVDACAGGGGKTLAIADLLKGRGRVYAYDVYEKKIRSLKQRAERAGERDIQAVNLPDANVEGLKKFEASADAVLVDAPCTGFGVLRRNPDIKWNRKPAELAIRNAEIPIEDLQMKVLEAYSPLVKSGGKLIYGVCTYSKSESIGTVEAFLKKHPEFKLTSQGFTGPFDTDGFFMASMTHL